MSSTNVILYRCDDNFFYKIIHYLLLATVAAVLFILLSLPSFDAWLSCAIPNFWYRLFGKAVILFVTVYIVDRLIEVWRIRHVVCNSPTDITLRQVFRQ